MKKLLLNFLKVPFGKRKKLNSLIQKPEWLDTIERQQRMFDIGSPMCSMLTEYLLSNGKYIAVIGLEKFMDVQFEKSAHYNIDYAREGTPRKDARYVSPDIIRV